MASPYSVRAALGLVYLASGGKSRERLKSRLVYPERADDLGARALDATVRAGAEVRFESASSIWISDGNRVQPAYLQAGADFLPGEVHAIDFNAEPERVRRFINAWASAHTRGDITEPFPESTLTSHTQPTLMDTAAFSGTWPPDFMSSVGKHAFSTFSVDGIVDALHVNMMYGGKCKAVFQGAVEAAIADLSRLVAFARGGEAPFLEKVHMERRHVLTHLGCELARRRAELDLGIPRYFSGDRAFYFLVVERGTGLILLMGQVIDPTVSAP